MAEVGDRVDDGRHAGAFRQDLYLLGADQHLRLALYGARAGGQLAERAPGRRAADDGGDEYRGADEVGDGGISGGGVDVVGGSDLHQAPLAHDRHLVGE